MLLVLLSMLYFFQQVLNGFHSGALYALLAFGYSLTNGVLHRTNIAYGSVFAFAGQTMILAAVFVITACHNANDKPPATDTIRSTSPVDTVKIDTVKQTDSIIKG